MPTSLDNPTAWTRASRHRVVDEGDARGRLQIYLPTGETCISVVVGHLTLRMAHRWIEVIDPYYARGIVFDTFHDWEKMESYDSSARRSLTTWVVANNKRIRSAHFLVGSKLVAMGVSAASLATALVGLPMRAHTDRATFEQEMAALLR